MSALQSSKCIKSVIKVKSHKSFEGKTEFNDK